MKTNYRQCKLAERYIKSLLNGNNKSLSEIYYYQYVNYVSKLNDCDSRKDKLVRRIHYEEIRGI